MEVLWKLVFTVGLLGSLCEGSISCKNEGGADVDWFILYKKNDGFKYVYTDSKDQNLKKGNKDINDQAGVLAHTLKPYFENYDTPSPDLEFIAYNDQPPPDDETVGQSYGHSKGVVMKDNNAVVWLLHSTPRFPFSGEKKDFYPKSGETNAQIFLCVTLESTEFKEIDQHLKDIKAYRFEESQPEKRARRTSVSSYSKVLKSKGGQEFKRFVKNVSKDRDAKVGDLYVTIADELKSDLYIQTWKSRPDCISETNKGHELYNIVSVKTSVGEWKHGSDHSKWCVSVSKDWTCVADSNREESQFARPGGALCINSKPVTDAFKDLISNVGKRKASSAGGSPPPKKQKV